MKDVKVYWRIKNDSLKSKFEEGNGTLINITGGYWRTEDLAWVISNGKIISVPVSSIIKVEERGTK